MGRITKRAIGDYTEFGAMVASILRHARIPHAALATALDVSPAALCWVFTGNRRASPEWVEEIANAIGATSEVRRNLHLAAARSVGYDIWLHDGEQLGTKTSVDSPEVTPPHPSHTAPTPRP